jgi:hypothetical protein
MSDTGPAPRAARVITQIAAAAGSESANRDVLYALADDGTIWRLTVKMGYGWFQLPALPQTDAPAPGTLPSTAL